MLEDCIMEKKPSRSVQPLGKGSGTESKKAQDGAGGKAFPRSSRRREVPGGSAPKYDPARKPTSQKGKTFDKRPRPRGPYMGYRKEGTQVADEEAEYGSVMSPGSKKQNLNHLLNFHYAPREGASQHWRNSCSVSSSGSGLSRYFRGAPHKYNKEQFLQANCQFVVKAEGDYRQYLYNPDQLVDWDLVEQIRVLSPEETSCPICLYPPVAAKMTRCGHIFCWSCILHYLALSDKTWRKCPICYESVHKKDLKSVQALMRTRHPVGDTITMRLMKRERGSLEAVPMEQWEQRPQVPLLSVSETAVDTIYAKLLRANQSDVLAMLAKEKSQLKEQLKSDEGSPEVCFVEQAMEMLLERETLIKGNGGSREVNQAPAAESTPEVVEFEDLHVVKNPNGDDTGSNEVLDKDGESTGPGADAVAPILEHNRPHLESMSSEEGSNLTAEDIEHTTVHPPSKHFYFYQAADGQHIFLHALNARMLEMGYGSLEACPPTITGRIVEKEAGSMTDELRRRLRYLQHLPVTCQFEVVEIALEPPIISQETLEVFREQVEARQRRRSKRAREETRREKKINEEENRRWGRHPTPRIRIASHHHFPLCGTDSSPPGVSLPHSASETSLASVSTHSPCNLSMENLVLDPSPPDVVNFPSVGQEAPIVDNSSPSFAQMLRDGKATFSGGNSDGVWGRPSTTPPLARSMLSIPTSRHRTTSDSEPEPEGYVPAPTFSQSFSDAIAHALAKSAGSSENISADQPCGKRKKKQKPKVLFATTMAFSGK